MQVLGCYCAGIYYCIYRIVLLSRPTSCALVQTAYFQAALCAGYAVGVHDAHCPPLLYDCRDRVIGEIRRFSRYSSPFGLLYNKKGRVTFFLHSGKIFLHSGKIFIGKQVGCPMGDGFALHTLQASHSSDPRFRVDCSILSKNGLSGGPDRL